MPVRIMPRIGLPALAALALAGVPARGQQAPPPPRTVEAEEKKPEVVRTVEEGDGAQTEVTTRIKDQENRRQIALLAAQVFRHLDGARRALASEDPAVAKQELGQSREAIAAIRALLPRATVHIQTDTRDGEPLYEDVRRIQANKIPLFEAPAQVVPAPSPPIAASGTSATIPTAPVAVRVIPQDVTMDLDLTESLVAKAERALSAMAKQACLKHIGVALAQAKGVHFDDRTQDVPLAEAHDAIALARKALEKHDASLARSSLSFARQRLLVYRELLPRNERQEVDQMLAEIEQLNKQVLRLRR